MRLSYTLSILCLLAALNLAADEVPCTDVRSPIRKAWDALVGLVKKTPQTDEQVKLARVKLAREKLMKNTGLGLESLGNPTVGGMQTSFRGQGEGVFHKNPNIPPELEGRPIKDFMVKVTHKDAPKQNILRDNEALAEIQQQLRPGSTVKLAETYVVEAADGTRLVYQRKAPGKKITGVLKDLFQDVFAKVPEESDLEILLQALMSSQSSRCFGPKHLVVNFELQCLHLVEDYHINLDKVGAKLQEKKYQNLMKTLHELRDLSEGNRLPRTSAHSTSIGLGNKLFWNENVTMVGGLDMSIENFHLEVRGDHVLAHIFDY